MNHSSDGADVDHLDTPTDVIAESTLIGARNGGLAIALLCLILICAEYRLT